ncbi:MAG: hypothetical protein DI607_07815 [Sphingomonas hengshuiensis]|nr:MAG: hypothetical protein DI607_07815 [Sphingomonas hengshuiensis]
MASDVTICNMALSHIGESTQVAMIDPPDNSVYAGLCATFYGVARAELIERGNWSFTLKRTTIAAVANPSTAWTFAYALPSDCLKVVRVLETGGTDDAEGAAFTIEGGVLFTDQENAEVVYCRDVTDANAFSPTFIVSLSYLLASYLAGPIVKGAEGTKVADAMRQRSGVLGSASAAISANAQTDDADYTSSSVVARS